MAQAHATEETAHEQGDDEHNVAQRWCDARVVLNQNGRNTVEHGGLGAAVEENAQEHHQNVGVGQRLEAVAQRGGLGVLFLGVVGHEKDHQNQCDEQHGGEDGEEDAESHIDSFRGTLRREGEPAVLHQRGADEHQDERGGQRADGLQRLGEGEHAGVFALGRHITDERVAGHLQDGGSGAHQQHRQQNDGEVERQDGQDGA